MEVLVHGNLDEHQAAALGQEVAGALGPGCAMAAGERIRDVCAVVPTEAEAAEKTAAAARRSVKEGEGLEGKGAKEEGGAGGLELARVAAEAGGTVVELLAKNPKEENAAVGGRERADVSAGLELSVPWLTTWYENVSRGQQGWPGPVAARLQPSPIPSCIPFPIPIPSTPRWRCTTSWAPPATHGSVPRWTCWTRWADTCAL